MPIASQAELTAAVLAEIGRAADPRFRDIMAAAVRHPHAFVREAQLTEAEFRHVCGVIASPGQATTASHNEVASSLPATRFAAGAADHRQGPGPAASVQGAAAHR